MGSGTWTLTTTGTVWNLATTTGLTFNAQTSRIVMNNTASPAVGVTFSGGGLTYYIVEFARGAATAANGVNGNNTYANFIDNTSTAAHSVVFETGTTHTFYKFNVRGSAGALVTLTRSGASGQATVSKAGQGVVCCDYINLAATNLVIAAQANTFFRGANSTGTSTNWVATDCTSSQSPLGIGGVG